MSNIKRPSLGPSIVALAVLLGSASPSRADFKIVSDVSLKGLPKPEQSTTERGTGPLTLYYKGTKVRAEREGSGKVSIVDEGKVYVLDVKAKTYYIADSKGVSDQPVSMTPKMIVTKTSETKTLLGKQAVRYNIDGSIEFQPSGAGGAGGKFGQKRAGGAGRSRGGGGLGGGQLSADLSGEIWSDPTSKVSAVTLFQAITSIGGESGSALYKQLSEGLGDAGLILGCTLRIKPPSIVARRIGEITLTIDTKSVQEQPLEDSLFQVPSDYKKVDPPTKGASDSKEGDSDLSRKFYITHKRRAQRDCDSPFVPFASLRALGEKGQTLCGMLKQAATQ
jgi:hypothetical protein